VLLIALTGTLQALVIVGQAFLLAHVIVAAFRDDARLTGLLGPLAALGLLTAARVGCGWVSEWASAQAAAAAKAQLRAATLAVVAAAGARPAGARPAGAGPAGAGPAASDLSLLATRGIEALDPWFSRFLPQLVLAVSVPLLVGGAIATQDPLSALIVVLTLPLIPLFAWLIGTYTRDRTVRQWAALSRMAGRFADLMTGLPTLLVLGRAREQVGALRTADDSYRRSTLAVLRISFLSSLWLELLGSLSVALVAVTIGLRLVAGDMDLQAGLTVLILIPEVYLPLRTAGAQFHAAAEGTEAARSLLAATSRAGGGTDTPGTPLLGRPDRIEVHGAVVDHGHRRAPNGVTATFPAGRVTAVVGESGSGKSTLLRVLLGLQRLDSGSVHLHLPRSEPPAVDLADVDLAEYWRHVGWVPQHPGSLAATMRESLTLHGPAPAADIVDALTQVGLGGLLDRLDDPIGEQGLGLSTGQRRRLALARVLLLRPGIVIVDEPTASLDDLTEIEIVEALQGQARAGAIVVLATHRLPTAALADAAVALPAATGGAIGSTR